MFTPAQVFRIMMESNGILARKWRPRISFAAAAALLLGLSCLLHFYRLSSIPDGLFIDECSVGYNAWCMAETGRDEHGTSWPVFFRC